MKSVLHLSINRSAVADVAIVAGHVHHINVLGPAESVILALSFTVTAGDVTTYATRAPFLTAKVQDYFMNLPAGATFMGHNNDIDVTTVLNQARSEYTAVEILVGTEISLTHSGNADGYNITEGTGDNGKGLIIGAAFGYVAAKALGD